MDAYTVTERTEVRRLPERARYDRETVHGILDEGLFAHVGFAVDAQPFVIPTAYVRVDETLYLHGSPASRMLRNLEKGVPLCVTVTLLDGLVLARSAFHHSMNYRSVVVVGTAHRVDDPDERLRVLEALVEHIVPGRSSDCRRPNDYELKFTKLLALPLAEASAKLRTGPPVDDEEDLSLPCWAGVIPLDQRPGEPLADAHCDGGLEPPGYATAYRRPR
jgi:nitroimidazol reductase NimA-like FMN-containing flavoprotein (pyridoxamine 5'-phosphate oxidase superfamily)